jgi:hypothetical protein
MKKTFIPVVVAFALAFTVLANFTGCAGVQQPASQIALQIVAQRVGYQVGKADPSIVPQAKLVAQGILASQTSDLAKVALNTAIASLTAQFNDPLLTSDIQLIVTGLNLNIPTAKIDLTALTPLINAFLSGLDIGAGNR